MSVTVIGPLELLVTTMSTATVSPTTMDTEVGYKLAVAADPGAVSAGAGVATRRSTATDEEHVSTNKVAPLLHTELTPGS
jgi:hypothetical protein